MAINRFELASRHNPVITAIEYKSPLTIGNGNFAFTADVTGLQSLYEEYKDANSPLCTMSQWGWHTTPVSPERYSYGIEDIHMTEYEYANRRVTYAVDRMPGNEEVYYWLRQNPHRMNLGSLGFLYKGERIQPEDITGIKQTLNLYEGILDSRFRLKGVPCRVLTCCHQELDSIAVRIESELLEEGSLSVLLAFPYGSPDISAADFSCPERHSTILDISKGQEANFKRILDRTEYYVDILFDQNIIIEDVIKHHYEIKSELTDRLSFSITFSEQKSKQTPCYEQVFTSSREGWKAFWKNGGAVDLHQSKDERAVELERRIVLSMYQSAIQSCGSMPPQETGLTCNSWHGKFHLEMYLWHLAYLPLWNRNELLERSLSWYLEHLTEAKANAARNGFKGAKWPKQVAYDGIDSPSPIATLLIWQQPHIIYMLELLYQSQKARKRQILNKYWVLVRETADYMVDLAVYNKITKRYDLVPPIIPAQEEHDPRNTLNPVFEVEYWRFTLFIAIEWAKRLKQEADSTEWLKVAENMAELPIKDGLYLAHENCPDTYESFNRDHPMMLAVYGLISSDRVNRETMENTLRRTIECWDHSSTWGWDYAMMAMTAVRLGLPELAIELLLMDTPNNRYVASGNNSQMKREDLPLYLPGNGSLLLAIPLMTAGFKDCTEKLPGFPKNGMWKVEYEDIDPIPY